MITKGLYTTLVCAIFIFSFTSCGNKSGKTEAETGEATEMEEHMHEESAENEAPAKKPASPRKASMAMVDGNHVHIDYSSPSVRGRVVFGGLVAYNQVWVTGAHKATSIDFQKPVKINGQEIEAGKYGFFTIPGEDTWTVIINKNWDMHLADDYDQALDVLRIEVKPQILDQIRESLEYQVESLGDNRGRISVAWDKIKVSFEIENI